MKRKATWFRVLGGILVLCSTAALAGTPMETIDAIARGTSTQMGKQFDIKVSIDQWSSDEDRAALKAAFAKGGNDALYATLNKMKGVGRIRIPASTGASLAYTRSIRTPTGRKIRFVTDRPIAIFEQRNMTRSEQYSLTCGELDINDQDKSKSTGVLYPAAKLKVNKEGELEFELFQNPWKLTNIIDWNAKK
jgi:hypothetical protein